MRFIEYPKVKPNTYRIDEYGKIYNSKNLCLKPYMDKDGYLKITLISDIKKNNKYKYYHYFIHRLVAYTYCIGYNNNLVVNHIDGNKLNNHYTNLEWCNVLKNTLHAKRLGLLNNSGINSYNRKYPVSIIHNICKLFVDGKSNKEVYEILTGNIDYKSNMGLYSLINKLHNKMIFKDICSQYDYESKLKKREYSVDDNTIISLILSGKPNYEILKYFNKSIIDRRFYNHIIYLKEIFT